MDVIIRIQMSAFIEASAVRFRRNSARDAVVPLHSTQYLNEGEPCLKIALTSFSGSTTSRSTT
jgi:hypothetical protein